MFQLEFRHICKRFGSQTALDGVNLSVDRGEFFSLLGPSGCGKSTLLRILAGLESPSSGEILWNGQRIDHLPARKRPFKMVFQKYALFPHLDVFENIAFGLRIQKTPKAEIEQRVREALDLVDLTGMEQRFPDTLSGGQAQRVALARALVNRPECVLLDEPLTALDQKLREHMQTELRLLQKRLGLTFIFVTHDQEEAMLLSDRIAVMNAGGLEQVSSPRDLYDSPQSLFSARFIGRRNEFQAELLNENSGQLELRALAGRENQGLIWRGHAPKNLILRPGTKFRIFVCPERMRVVAQGSEAAPRTTNTLQAEFLQHLFRGSFSEVILRLSNGQLIRVFVDRLPGSMRSGELVTVEFALEHTHIFADTAHEEKVR